MKPILEAIADPLFLLFLFGVCFFLWYLGRRRWSGASFLFLVLGTVYFLATVPGANLLLRPLEDRYPALLNPPQVPAIVVLSGGENHVRSRPVLSDLPPSTLARLVEGVRLFRLLEGRPVLWVVGGAGFVGEGVPLMAQAAWELGVPKDKVRWLTASRNTWEDAAQVATSLGSTPFILVTSAFHMPRALRSFWAHGLDPVPAPCGHRTLALDSLGDFLPSTSAFSASALAVREYLALLWYRLCYFRG